MAHLYPVPPAQAVSPFTSTPHFVTPDAGGSQSWPAALSRWLNRLRERDELAGLTGRERRDAGITAYDVAFETRKLPWRD